MSKKTQDWVVTVLVGDSSVCFVRMNSDDACEKNSASLKRALKEQHNLDVNRVQWESTEGAYATL